MYNFFLFLFYSIWTEYAIVIMYLINLKIFVYSDFCCKFFKSHFEMQWTQISY